jgi:hypothetical protein
VFESSQGGCGFKGATGASRSCEVHTEDAAPVAEFGNAAAAGDAGRIKEMLRDHPGLAKATGGETPLAIARKMWPGRGNDVPDIVTFLIAHGAKD